MCLKVTKCVWQFHDNGIELQPVFDYFRHCTNESIRIGSQKKITSKFSLHKELYYKLRSDGFAAKLVYGSLECAAAKLKQHKKANRKNPNATLPYVWKNMLCLDNQSYKIDYDNAILRVTIKPKKYCYIKLSSYVLEQLENAKLGSITITCNKLVISYSKEITEKEPEHYQGIDRNLDNATSCDTRGKFTRYHLKKANQIKEKYRKIKSKFKRNDVRIRKKIFTKYGRKERNRAHQLLHKVSKQIVSKEQGIVLEDISGIRRLYRKGNGQGNKYRFKMNSWNYYELQRQIEYKAKWAGLPVQHVKAAGTSSKCAECGIKLIPEEHRMMWCPNCRKIIDRDVNAARNILARGLWLRPDALQGEVMRQSKDAEQIAVSQVVVCQTKT